MTGLTSTASRTLARLAGVTSLAVAMLMAAPAHAQAQNYSPMRFDLGLAAPYGLGIHAFGIGAFLEGKYNITDQIDAGLRLEGNAQLGGSVDDSGQSASLGAAAYVAVLAKGEYFFTTSSTRPFVGLGAGIYHLGGATESGDSSGGASATATAGSFFGLAPQIGVNFGGFRLALSYNKIFTGSSSSAAVSTGGTAPSVPSMDYLLLDLAFQIGGGRISPAPSQAGLN